MISRGMLGLIGPGSTIIVSGVCGEGLLKVYFHRLVETKDGRTMRRLKHGPKRVRIGV